MCVCEILCLFNQNYVVLDLCHLFSDPDLQVKVSPQGQLAYLDCDSMCANPTIIWYRNGEYFEKRTAQVCANPTIIWYRREGWDYIDSIAAIHVLLKDTNVSTLLQCVSPLHGTLT